MKMRLILLGGALAVAAGAPVAASTLLESLEERKSLSQRLRDCRDLFVAEAGGDAARRFVLSWRGLQFGTEECLLDGITLAYGRDYELDYNRGVLHLRRAAAPGAVLQVAYSLCPLRGARNVPFAATELASAVVPSLELTPPGLPSGPVARRLAAPSAAPAPKQRGRRGERLAVSLDPGRERRAAETPGQLRDQLLSGLRQTELQQRIEEGRQGTATVSYLRADPLDPQSATDAREEFDSRIDLRPNQTSRLMLATYLSRDSLFSEDYEEIDRRRLQFERTMGQSTVGLMWDRTRRDGYGMANALDALSLTLNHPFNQNVSAEGLLSYEDSLYRGRELRSLITVRDRFNRWLSGEASVHHRQSSFSGNTLESGLTVSARPGKKVDAELTFRDASSERYGRYRRTAAEVNAALTDNVQLLGEVSQRYSDTLGTINTFGLGMSARPTASTLLEAAFSESLGEQIGRERSQSLRLVMDPSAALRIQLGYDLMASTQSGRAENALWLVTIGGRRYVKLEGYRGIRSLEDESLIEDALYRVEVRPLDAIAFSGSLRRVGSDEDLRSLATVGASLRVLRALEVSALYRRPTEITDKTGNQFGRDFRLTLAPVGGFRLFGEYSTRPEDERGMLLEQVNRTVGLETQLGSFGLQGSLTSIFGSVVTEPGRQADFLASLNVTSGTKLYGGLRTIATLGPDQPRSEILRVGISQTAGPSLFLLLEGQFGYLRSPTGMRTPNPEDTRAQARLGLRF